VTEPELLPPPNPAGAARTGRVAVACLAAAALAACNSSGSPPPPGAQGPLFVIASPQDGATVSGPVFFSVQPLRSAEVQGVTFTAGGKELLVDAPGEDAFKVFLVPRDFPDGPLTLHAAVTDKDGGRSERSITVNVLADPPSSGTVGAAGATLGTHEASGALSTLSIPAGVAHGAAIRFTARSKEEVKAATGIDYDALGVTFLGAQEIDSTLPITAPVGVSSGGFGPMVQPGQAVLNYMILPDGDGDGIGELVAVNGATVAPGGDIVSNPMPQLQLGPSGATASAGVRGVRRAQVGPIAGPPGTFVELEATGFNLFSPLGNVAAFHSLVGGEDIELPAFVNPHLETPGASPTIGFWLPVLPAGDATVTLRNVSAGSALAPISLTIEAPLPLPKEPAAVIDDTLAEAIRVLSKDPGLQDAVDRLVTERSGYAALAANPSADEAQALSDIAVFMANSNILDLLAQLDTPAIAALASASGGCSPGNFQSAFVDVTMGAYSFEMAAINLQLAVAIPPLAILGGADLFLGGKFVARGMGRFLSTLEECLTPDPPPLPPIEPTLRSCNLTFVPMPATPPPSGGPDGLRLAAAQVPAPPPMTGMGSVIPPGGDACGSALGGPPPAAAALRALRPQARASGSHSLASTLGDLTGRFVVKVFFGAGSSVPFSGVSDASGYFYIPVVPAGQPFQAIAFDTLTGETREANGVGPEVGQSTYLSFDFFATGTSGAKVLTYDTNTQGSYGGVDLYLFQGKAGDVVNLAVFSELSPLTGVRYQLADANGTPLISGLTSGGHYFDTGFQALAADGLYTFSLDGSAETGSYTLGLALIDPPTPIDISVPLVGNLATVGDSQFYSFAGSAGDVLQLTLGPDGASVLNAHLLVREPQANVAFYAQHVIGGLFTTSTQRSASGSVTLGSTGEHLLELKHDDPFEADLQKYLGGYRVDIAKTP